MLVYGPVWISVIFNVWCYMKSIIKMRGELHDGPYIKQIIQRLFMYPFLLLMAWIPATVCAFVQSSDTGFYALLLMVMSITHLQGFMNALYYGWTKKEGFLICCQGIFGGNSSRSESKESVDALVNQSVVSKKDNEIEFTENIRKVFISLVDVQDLKI